MNKDVAKDIELVMKARVKSVRFRKIRDNACGQYDYDKDEITLNINWRGNPIKAYVHELLHKIDPNWGNPNKGNKQERHSPAREDRVWHNLTVVQKVILGKRLFGRKWRYKYGIYYSVR